MVWYLRLIVVSLLFLAAGCVQFTPQFLLGNNSTKAELLWQRGLVLEAKKSALMVGEKEPGYKEARVLLIKIKILSLEIAREHMKLGEDYDKAGITFKAAIEYKKSLQYNPSNPLVKRRLESLQERGVPGLKSGASWSKAFGKKRVEETDPETSANIHYMRGKIYLESKAYPEAIKEFKAVGALVPAFNDTKILLERAVEGRKQQVDRHFRKGIAYFQQEQMELAVDEWSAVLRMQPAHKEAKEYKGRAEQIIERIKKIKERQRREAR